MDLDTKLRVAAASFLGGSYATTRPQCPYPLPSGLPTLPNGKATNCSTMTACLLAACYPEAEWTRQRWGQLQVYDGARLDSPVAAIEEMGLGNRQADFTRGRWHLVQGWVSTSPPRGHAFLVYGLEEGRELVLQASTKSDIGPTLDTKARGWAAARYYAAIYIARLGEP